MKRTITITQGLNELKLLDSRIEKAIQNATFVNSAKKVSKVVGAIDKEVFKGRAISDYQSINDLIKERATIKSAIVKSNALTDIKVVDEVMTVAEAIERKISIQYDKQLLEQMKFQYSISKNDVEVQNNKVNEQVNKLLETMVSKESSKQLSKEDQDVIEKPYRANHEYELVDPLSVYDKISELEKRIDDFESAVDTALCVSNASTFIEV